MSLSLSLSSVSILLTCFASLFFFRFPAAAFCPLGLLVTGNLVEGFFGSTFAARVSALELLLHFICALLAWSLRPNLNLLAGRCHWVCSCAGSARWVCSCAGSVRWVCSYAVPSRLRALLRFVREGLANQPSSHDSGLYNMQALHLGG